MVEAPYYILKRWTQLNGRGPLIHFETVKCKGRLAKTGNTLDEEPKLRTQNDFEDSLKSPCSYNLADIIAFDFFKFEHFAGFIGSTRHDFFRIQYASVELQS